MSRYDGNTREELSRGTTTAVAALCGVQFLDVLGTTVIVTALPRMLADLGADAAQGSLIVTAYATTFGGLLLWGARAGDRWGRRRVLLASIALFVVSSLAGVLAGSVFALAAVRAAQGLAAALSVPAALSLLTTLVPEGSPRRRAVSAWSAAGAAAGATGFVIGGVFTELATWRAIYLGTAALAVVLGLAVLATVPPSPGSGRRVSLSAPSSLLITAGAMGLVLGTSLLGERSVVAGGLMAVLGAAAMAAFGFRERRVADPLVPQAAWQSTALRWGALGSFTNTAATSGSVTVATLHLQGALGLSPLSAGLVLLSFSVSVVAASALAPRLLRARGWNGVLAAGLALMAAGNFTFLLWPWVGGVAAGSCLAGAGIGIASVAATDLGTHVPDEQKATASGILNTSAQLGTALSTAALLLLMSQAGPGVAWAAAALVAGGVGVLALRRAPHSDVVTV